MYPTIFELPTLHLGPIHLPIAVHSYGLMMALAFLTCMYMGQREFKRKGLEPRLASSIILWGALGGIIGAKLYSSLQDGSLSLRELFSNSGLVWYGGLIGGFAAAIWVIHRSSDPLLPTLDALAPLLLLGYGIGRIGCFLSGDGDYGPPSDLPWAMPFPRGTVPINVPVHPTPLYEFGLSLVGFALLWSIRKKKEGIAGWLVGAGLIAAGVERFIAEFWRTSERVIAGLTTAQLISIALAIVGSWIIYGTSRRSSSPVEEVGVPASHVAGRRKRVSR